MSILKRAFDIIISLVLLLALSPILALVAVLIGFTMGLPVVFRQKRPGLHGKIFTLYKFRTMRNSRMPNGAMLPDEKRLTRFGKFLRSTSIDELPELFNVLKGEMSLVGPRPLLVEYLDRYTPTQARRHEVRPGITGWAQVNGRNALSWKEKFALDVWYVDSHTFWIDIRILAMTLLKVFKRDGITADGHATMPEFIGEAMNVLITSAGRRVSLLKAFQEAVNPLGSSVFAGDIDSLAPSLYVSDMGFALPSISMTGYIDSLLDIVREHRIKLIVPTIDTELPALSKAAIRFREFGCCVLISSEQLVEISRDKWLTYQYFSKHGIKIPSSWLPENIPDCGLPEYLFVKPRDGSASQHAHRIHKDQLDSVLPLVPNPVIQEDVLGQEITIDALIDLEGKPVHYVPRLRVKTIGGESVQGVTISDSELRDWIVHVLDIIADYGGLGPITIQAFLADKGPVLSEINPRFGGGFPLTNAAGGRYPEMIVKNLKGERLSAAFGEYQIGLHMSRYHVELFTEALLW